jgi:hypothetical protein
MLRVVAGEKRSLPNIDFAVEAEHCPGCGGGLHVLKSNRRQVVTLAHGPMQAREIQKQCTENGCCLLISRLCINIMRPLPHLF